ncbi:MAG: dihydroorotase [Candidatus Pacebacteria bacterium]|nr:dihydroorotase [Candidatus Paceibacterota bacterium]
MTQKPQSRLIRGARLVDSIQTSDSPQDLLIIDGKIAEIGETISAPPQTETIDAAGLYIAPGLIDIRVQTREPGGEHEETLESAVESAVAGGITQLICLPNTDPPLDEPALIAWIRQRGQSLGKTRIHAYGSLTKGRRGEQLAEMGLLQESGAIGFTDSPQAIGSARLMVQALKYARGFNSLVLSHPEEPSLASGMMNEGELATRLGLAGRSSLAETLLVERDCLISEATGSRLHIGPVTSAAAIDAIRRAKARGARVSCDTAAHYFTLTEMAVGNWRSFAKVAPPLRSESDRLAVIAGLKDGTIDAVSSDHSPRAPDSKRLPFAQASFGMVGLETLFPLTLDLFHHHGFTLAQALSLVTAKPAAIVDIKGGTIDKGEPADLIIFDPNQDWKIDPEQFKSRSKNSPLLEYPVKGRIHQTLIAGRVVYQHQP